MLANGLRSLMLLILLLVSGCSKLENSLNVGKLDCGEDLGSSSVVKALQPNGAEFSSLAVSSATEIDANGVRLPLRTTSKSCVVIPEKSKAGSYILIQVTEAESQYFFFGPIENADRGGSLVLKSPLQPRFEWSCPLSAATSATSLTLATETDASVVSPYVLRYRIKKGDTPLSEKWLIQPMSIDVDLKKGETAIPDGSYWIQMDLFDVNQNKDWNQTTRSKSCEVVIDNEAPTGMHPNFGNSTFGLLGETFLEVEPGRTVYFPNAEGFIGDIFYCLVELADDGTEISDYCSHSEDFSRLASNVFLPTSGLWRFLYFARDQAGNKSAIESSRIAIVDGKNLANLLLRVKTSVLLLVGNPVDALDLAVQNFFEFMGLKSQVEKARVQREVTNNVIAAALQGVPRRRSLDTESVVDFKVDTRNGDVLYLNGEGYLKRLNADTLELVAERKIEDASPLIVPDMNRVYAFDDSALIVRDLKGDILANLELGRKVDIANYQVLSDSSVIMFYNALDIIILNDKDTLLLNKQVQQPLQDIYLIAETKYKTLAKDDKNRIVLSSGEGSDAIIDPRTCFPEEHLVNLPANFTPKGNYVQTQSMGRFALYNLKGEQVHCSYDDIGWVDRDEKFAVVLDYVDERNNDGKKFYLTLYELFKTEGERAAERLETVYYSDLSEGAIERIEFLNNDFFLMEYYNGMVKLVDFDGNTVSQVAKLDLGGRKLQYDPGRKRIIGSVGVDLVEWLPFEQPVQKYVKSWPARPKRGEYRLKFFESSALLKNEDKLYFAQNMQEPWKLIKETKLELRQAESNSSRGRIAYSLGDWGGETVEILEVNGTKPIFSLTLDQAEILRLKWVSSTNELLVFDNLNKLYIVSETFSSYEYKELNLCQGSLIQDIAYDRSGSLLSVSCQDGLLKLFNKVGTEWAPVGKRLLDNYAVMMKMSPQGDGLFFTDDPTKVGAVKYWDFRGPIRNLSDDVNFDFEFSSVAKSGTSILGLTSSGICRAKVDMKTAECLAPPGSYIGGFEYIEELGILVVHRDERLLDLYDDAGTLIATIKPPRLDNPRRTSYVLDFSWFEEKLIVAGLAGIFAYELKPENILAKHCEMSGLNFEVMCKAAGFSFPNR